MPDIYVRFSVICTVFQRVDLYNIMCLFRFPRLKLWNRYIRGSGAHCKWPPFLEFE